MLVYHMNVKDIQIHDNNNDRNDDNENKNNKNESLTKAWILNVIPRRKKTWKKNIINVARDNKE